MLPSALIKQYYHILNNMNIEKIRFGTVYTTTNSEIDKLDILCQLALEINFCI
jgi:hypothetical protein